MRSIVPRPAYRRGAAGSDRTGTGRALSVFFAVTATVLAPAATAAPHITPPVGAHASLPQPDFVISCVSVYPAPPGIRRSVDAGSKSAAASYPYRATVTVTNIGRGAAVNELITVAAISGWGDVGFARFRHSFAPGARVNVEFAMSQKLAFFKVQAEKESNTANDTRNGSPHLSKANTCPEAPLVRIAAPPRRPGAIRLAPHTPKLNPQPEPPSKR